MATDEEYLDNLLKSLTENQQPRTMEQVLKEVAPAENPDRESPNKENTNPENEYPVSSDDLADMLDKIVISDAEPEDERTAPEFSNESEVSELMSEPLGEEEPEAEVLHEEEPGVEPLHEAEPEAEPLHEEQPETDSARELQAEDVSDASNEEEEDWKSDIDELLESVSADENEGDLLENALKDADLVTQSEPDQDIDVTELIDQMPETEVDEDLAEINGLLKKVDNNSAVDDDMLALLESVKEPDDGQTDEPEKPFDLLGSDAWKDGAEEGGEETADIEETGEKKKKKRKKGKGLFGRKKKDSIPEEGQNEAVEDGAEEPVLEQAIDENGQLVNIDEVIPEIPAKQGLLARIFALFTEEEPEEELDENERIMQELDEEDKANEKKKGKKKKEKKKKDKKGSGEVAEGEDAEEAAESGDGKKRKGKKEKKKKEKAEKVKEKPVKVLSRKNFLLMIAFCATLIACILALSTFLSEYADKQNARAAYYRGDYETAYEMLYDKNMSGSDQLIFNRVKAVLQMERRIQSYENNLSMGRELEALDSLLRGISLYQSMTEADYEGVKEEVDALYQQICNILSENYGLSEADIEEINAYDDETYTRRLDSLVNGTEFALPGQEAEQEPQPPQDILQEEEDIISY